MAAERGSEGTKTSISSNIDVPFDSNERFSMPNINLLVKNEADRLIKELIDDMRTFVVSDFNYESIDFIPEENSDINNNRDVIYDTINQIAESMQKKLNKGTPGDPDYNPGEFLKMFDIRYNTDTGQSEITLNLDFEGGLFENISIKSINIERR